MSTPSFDPGIAGGKVVEVDLPINAGVTKVAEAARAVKLDGWGHVVPPPGTETLGQALLDLPNDIGGWAISWLDGWGVMDWLDDLNITAMLAPVFHVLSGGLLQWITLGFLGLRIFSMGHNMIANRHRGPVSLIYYRVSNAAYEPVAAFLQSRQIEMREPVSDGNHTLIRIPVYHTRKARETFEYLHKKTALEYTIL